MIARHETTLEEFRMAVVALIEEGRIDDLLFYDDPVYHLVVMTLAQARGGAVSPVHGTRPPMTDDEAVRTVLRLGRG